MKPSPSPTEQIKKIEKLGDIVTDSYDLYKSMGLDRHVQTELRLINKINEIVNWINNQDAPDKCDACGFSFYKIHVCGERNE